MSFHPDIWISLQHLVMSFDVIDYVVRFCFFVTVECVFAMLI